MPKSTCLYLISIPLTVAGVAVSLLADREWRREHTAVWKEASKDMKPDGVSGDNS